MFNNYILLLGLISYIYDISIDNYYNICKNNLYIHFLLLIHHIISVYIHFGWININLSNKKLYLLLLLLTIIHWKTNNNKCIFTQYINNKCNVDVNYPFRNIIYFIGLKNNKFLYYIYLFCIFIYVFNKKN